MKKFLLLACLLFVVAGAFSQSKTATTPVAGKDTTAVTDLLGDLNQSTQEQQSLLPKHILFTQRMLWGNHGLMRNFDKFELTPEKRQAELKLRRGMLIAHQIMGTLTLGGMVAQGIVGAKLYNGQNVKDLHEGLAAAVNFGYFTTAALSLFAPPRMLDEHKGYSSIKVHRALAIVHLSAMIATNILAGQIEGNPSLKPYHRAAAFTAFGAFAASMIVIKF
ncbi:MAG: hypothetical protein LWW85_13765 [Marinilabiliales bacterium]|nr:hypothetical protein [Marinilabiliales bacterium]